MRLDSSPLVSTEWLAAHLTDPGLRVLDVRWRSRYESGRGISFDDPEDYRLGHIPGAVFGGVTGSIEIGRASACHSFRPPSRTAA